jgi:hypothetical protein
MSTKARSIHAGAEADTSDVLSRRCCPSKAVGFNLESFILVRRPKVASDQIELRICRRKLMFGAAVAPMQPASTYVLVHLKVV